MWKRGLDSGGRLRDVQKERHIGVDKNGWSVIQLDAGKELQLEPEKFTLRDEGQYFIKTYVLKYQEYLMQDWNFWFEGKSRKLTYDEIIEECGEKGIVLWRYSNRHQIDWIEVLDLPSSE